MKLPFRKQKPSDLPKEVQDYYQAEKREKVGVAGLLAVATLVVTVLLAMGLFFGGRWAYRAIFDNGDSNQVAQKDQKDDENVTQDRPAEQPVDSNDEQAETGDGEPEAPAEGSTPAPSTTTPNSNIPSTGTSDLPNTGPADTAAIVAAAVVISGSLFYVVRRPQEQ